MRIASSPSLDEEALPSRVSTQPAHEQPAGQAEDRAPIDLAQIYLAHRDLFFSIALEVLGPDEHQRGGTTPLDVVSAAIERILSRGFPDTVTDGRTARAYVVRTVKNVAIDAVRRGPGARDTQLDPQTIDAKNEF